MLKIRKKKQWGVFSTKAGGAIGLTVLAAFVIGMSPVVAPTISTLAKKAKSPPPSTPIVPLEPTSPVVPTDPLIPPTTPTTPTSPIPVPSNYYSHTVIASVFWLGEKPSADNSYITNTETAWDPIPVTHFGGYDDPYNRTATGLPAAFTPKHNPYYYALPVSEYDSRGNLYTQSRTLSPWANETVTGNQSLLKGRWIRVQNGEKVVYAQWIDVGPYQEKDYAYVYGTAAPLNTIGLKAGLDLSPAAAFTLGVNDVGTVTWRFADPAEAAAASGQWNNFPAVNNINYW